MSYDVIHVCEIMIAISGHMMVFNDRFLFGDDLSFSSSVLDDLRRRVSGSESDRLLVGNRRLY